MTWPHNLSEGIPSSDGSYVTLNPFPVPTRPDILDDEDRAELQAHRDGIGHLAEDVMHAGQPVHEIYSHEDGESHWWLQVTHQGMPLWSCACCSKLTIEQHGWGAPEKCAGCEHGTADDLGPLLYPNRAACQSWTAQHGGGYTGPCLIAGSDGCECEDRP